MRVVWTPEAQQDRVDIWDYIAAGNPLAAARQRTIARRQTGPRDHKKAQEAHNCVCKLETVGPNRELGD